MVFERADSGAGHPGHDKCKSWIEDKKIVTESLSGKWKWSWKFFNDHAVLEVLSADTSRTYCFGNHESRIVDLNGDGFYDIVGKPYNWDVPRFDICINKDIK